MRRLDLNLVPLPQPLSAGDLPPQESFQLGTTDPVVTPPADIFLGDVAPAVTPSLAATSKGVLAHSTHLADLLLDIVPGHEQGLIPACTQYQAFVTDLIEQIEVGKLRRINEKIDGSPAILLGVDTAGIPFVAYKLGLERKGGARLVRTATDAREHFHDPVLAQIFVDCIENFGPALARWGRRDVMFQADLLFTPHNGAKTTTRSLVKIRANPSGIEYVLRRTPRYLGYYEPVREAQIGVVVHTVITPVTDPTTGNIVRAQACDDDTAIADFVDALDGNRVFAIHPWSHQVKIDQDPASRFSATQKDQIMALLDAMRTAHQGMSREFRAKWDELKLNDAFAIYLNAGLKPGSKGGIYRAAASNEPFDFEKIVAGFRDFLVARAEWLLINPEGKKSTLGPKSKPAALDTLLRNHEADLRAFMESYYNGIRIQALLAPHLKEANVSKLGGGPTEGFMLKDPATGVQVKVVDRLIFTMQNFAGEGKRVRHKSLPVVREPDAEIPTVDDAADTSVPESVLGTWRDGNVFWPTKGQPFHAGHAQLLAAAVLRYGADRVFALPSRKAPNLAAGTWQELGVTESRQELTRGAYTHVFSLELRREILRHALPLGVNAIFADHRALWSHVKNAQDQGLPGQVVLLVGEKELRSGRYEAQLRALGSHLRLEAMPMQEAGLSATDVRRSIATLLERGERAAYENLVRALSFIQNERERDSIIGQMVHEWKKVQKAAERVLG